MELTNRNLKKSLNLTGKTITSGGAFCSYYKVNSTQGIKVLYSDGHKTIKALRNSLVWRRATKENTLLRKCKERYENIPVSYGVYPIKIGKYFYPGIVMQHLDGNTLKSLFETNEDAWYSIAESINRALTKRGIYHSDIHANNVILSGGKYYIIDFTYDLVELDNGYN